MEIAYNTENKREFEGGDLLISSDKAQNSAELDINRLQAAADHE